MRVDGDWLTLAEITSAVEVHNALGAPPINLGGMMPLDTPPYVWVHPRGNFQQKK